MANDISKAMINQLINGEDGVHVLEYEQLILNANHFNTLSSGNLVS